MCDSKELLVGFLYDEIDSVSKRSFERHLLTCADCRDELTALADSWAFENCVVRESLRDQLSAA